MAELAETTFGNVVLGGTIWYKGEVGQKVDEPLGSRNKHGQSFNVMGIRGVDNIGADEKVKTTIYSQKDKPELRHV